MSVYRGRVYSLNQIKRFEIIPNNLFKEMSDYRDMDIEKCNVYLPSVTNSAILWVLYDFYHGYITEYNKDKMIDFIIAYDFGIADGLLDIDLFYKHLQDILNDMVDTLGVRPHKLMVHKDDLHKF